MSDYNGQFDAPVNYDYLDSYEQEYKPEQRFEADLSTVTDGDHEFAVQSAEIKTTKNGKPILEVRLKVDGGNVIKHSWWHEQQEDLNAMCADLGALGFPAHTWGKGGVPLSKAIPEAVKQLQGRVFRAVKKTDKPTEGKHAGKVFHKLYISGLVKASTMPPPAAGFNEFAQQPAAAPITDWKF